jgi:hypothetical protein
MNNEPKFNIRRLEPNEIANLNTDFVRGGTFCQMARDYFCLDELPTYRISIKPPEPAKQPEVQCDSLRNIGYGTNLVGMIHRNDALNCCNRMDRDKATIDALKDERDKLKGAERDMHDMLFEARLVNDGLDNFDAVRAIVKERDAALVELAELKAKCEVPKVEEWRPANENDSGPCQVHDAFSDPWQDAELIGQLDNGHFVTKSLDDTNFLPDWTYCRVRSDAKGGE